MSGFFSSIKRATSASFDGQGGSGDPSEGATAMRFTIHPAPGDSGFQQWAAAMKMVAQLPGGIPSEFRRRLWLTLAERHLAAKGVDWPEVERSCLSEWSHPADGELGVQIVKDLHRTGCSLFCGEDGQENQALLKRVLLAYARWNKAVGYCQGFNMLAALILQVTDKCESDALKLMIYLIEGVLPDSYFADSLRGLSVDMAVFRELLRSRLPRLSRHLDTLQNAAKDGNRSYEPPLTNVFTMQWFLTLFCNCLPQPSVLRVWDLILLEGNEILLRTALAIWQVLADRILSVRSADEFYCIMGVLTRELLEFDLVDGNSLIKAVIAIGPLTELKSLREHFLYNINPWGPSVPQAVVEKQLKLYSRQSIALDISALKKQYAKLKQRQRQAHIIFSAAISRQSPPSAPVTMNHLLLGKSALMPAKRLGPPKGAIPPARQAPSTLMWKDTPKQSSSSSSSDTELCDDDGSGGSSNEEEPGIKMSQCDDNLPPASDNILMRTDNTASAKTSARETLVVDTDLLEVDVEKECSSPPSQTILTEHPSEPSDTFDTASNTAKSLSESDDENFDFERFLADRVKCLKGDNKEQKEESEDRINYARRNSAKALQIIQENSLILHRILQCQSRLSPSPPTVLSTDATCLDDADMLASSPLNNLCSTHCYDPILLPDPEQIDTPSPDIGQEPHAEINTSTYPDILTQILFDRDAVVNTKELKSPEYGSKYTSILEKSKSLDERYNALILNIPPLKQSVSEQKSITRICEEKSKLINDNKTFKPSTFCIENLLYEDYSATSPENFDMTSSIKEEFRTSPEEHQTSNSPTSIIMSPQNNSGNFETGTSEQRDLTTKLIDKIYLSPQTGSPELVPTSDYSVCSSFQTYEDFSYHFPTDTKKPDDHAPTDLNSLTNFSCKVSEAFDFKDFAACNTDGTDSGVSFMKSSTLDSDLSSVTSPKHSLAEDATGFKPQPVENGQSDTSYKYSFAAFEEEREHAPFYKDLLSQVHNYPQPPEDQSTLSKENPLELGLDKSFNDAVEKTPLSQNKYVSQSQNEPSGQSSKVEVDILEEYSMMKSLALSVNSHGDCSSSKSPLKSPSKVFNPFPVPLNSRQHKEVPLKLGLYKK